MPILYSFRRCPYAMRARMGLLVAGQAVELREVVLRAKPDAMLAASAKGTVPVLVLPAGHVIDESIDILRWALALHDPEHWLEGDDAALIAGNDGAFKRDLDRYKYPERYKGDPMGADPLAHRAAGMDWLAGLNLRLSKRAQLCGEDRTLADIALFPFVRQFAEVDRGWFDAQPLPHLHRWLAGHLASDLFARAMLRVPAWQPGDMVTVLR